ncbi:MAG: hypothetical protein IPL61_24350 [Myxococcales bacterium]|nr:hypothetical protein [Myxococcales bacterium]
MTSWGARVRRQVTWPRVVFTLILLFWVKKFLAVQPYTQGDVQPTGQYQRVFARLDGHYIHLERMSLFFDGDLELGNQLAQWGDPLGTATLPTTTGKNYLYPIGSALLELPAFAIAHGVAKVENAFGAHIPMHGYDAFHQRWTFFSALLAGFGALLIGYRLARRHASETAALFAVSLVGLGTGLYFWSVFQCGYAHAWSALAVAWVVDYWDATRGRHDLRRYAYLGALLGFVILARAQDVTIAALPLGEGLIELARRARRQDGRGVARMVGYALAALAAMLLVSAPQTIVFLRYFHHPFGPYSQEGFMQWSAPYLWEVLFSSKHGLFRWTPLAYLSILGLLFARGPERRYLAGWLTVAFFLQVWVNGSTWDFWGFWGFGARRMAGVTVAHIVGAAFLVDGLRALHARFPAVVRRVALAIPILPMVCVNLDLSQRISDYRLFPLTDDIYDMSQVYIDSLTREIRRFDRDWGSPTAWPHNWLWAWQHDLPIERHDVVFGGERLWVNNRDWGVPGTVVKDGFRLSPGACQRHCLGPWRFAKIDTIEYAYPEAGAELIVPLFAREHVHLKITGRAQPPALELEANGRWLSVPVTFDGPQVYRFDLPDGSIPHGPSRFRFRCAGGPPCVGIDRLEFVYQAD